MRRILLLSLTLAVFAGATAAETLPLTKLAWLTGRWVDDSGGNLSEETWSAPSGDSMIGMWRLVQDGKARLFEMLTIKAEADGVVLRLRHFDPKLVGREEKETPLELTLAGWYEREARFEGPGVSGLSQGGRVVLTYRRPDENTLICTLERGGQKEDFSFHRAP